MQFQSAKIRSMWASFALGVGIDLSFAYGISYIWGTGDLANALLIFGVMQAVYLVLWLKRTAVIWLFFFFGWRNKMSGHLDDFLRENSFPEPDQEYDSVSDYLARAMNNERLRPSVRIKAATELATLAMLPQFGLVQMALQLNLAFEDGLKRFKRSFPARSDNAAE